MREHKYRVWDKKRKEMLKSNDNGTCKVYPEVYDSAFIFVGLKGEVMKYERERTRGATFFDAGIQGKHEIDGTNGNFVLMQFTGLKDKNGKEIWEGDILKADKKKYGFIYMPSHSKNMIGVVEWVEQWAEYQLNGEPISGNLDDWGELRQEGDTGVEIACDYLKVIGNIYENKELIK